jgi:hypothetical protein
MEDQRDAWFNQACLMTAPKKMWWENVWQGRKVMRTAAIAARIKRIPSDQRRR